ncbi:hypothetical protein F5144DRAFT_374804 [Chaetomium tenue]|uniref:Uncharacterized protein n=1 Tax=Chaetomium tenue TaxID=1854479 RepID=A0ACB7NZP4_9PEZI|nr:hypothetical protein F5144DRAFT_374804 [Chaetomium globosum]
MPGELPYGENPDHDEGQGDELGDWLLQKKEYLEWKKYPQGLLWLYGDSGCGKSLLCSTIINRLNKVFTRDDSKTKVLAYWYFRFDLDKTKMMDLFLISLIRQLASKCQGFADNKSLRWFRGHQDSGELPDDTNELFNYLKKFISKIDKDIFIVLDGLDQVTDRQRTTKTGPLKLLDIIKRLTRQGYPNLHILVASGDEKDIRLCLETNMADMLVSVDVKKGLGGDLDKFIERKLEDLQILKGNQPLKQAVNKRLSHDQDSNFLWAASVLEQVLQSRDAQEIQEVLNRLPDNIVSVYQTALETVAAKDTKRMKLILLWMLRQQRPLSHTELAAAVGLHSPSAVTEICSRVLIQTSKQRIAVTGQERELDVFRFTHFSAQEYLEAVFVGSLEKLGPKPERVARFKFSPQEDAHIQVTKGCLAILSACISSQKNKAATTRSRPGSGSDSDSAASGSDAGHGRATAADTDAEGPDSDDSGTGASTSSSIADGKCTESPARRYAAEYWFCHYNMVNREKAPNHLVKDLDDEVCSQLLLNKKKLRFWLKIYDPDDGKVDKVPSPIYYAIKLKLEGILVQLITQIGRLPIDAVDRRKAILNRRGSEGTALQLATHLGNLDALDALIEHGADVNSEKGLHGTALYVSAAQGNDKAVEKLLNAGANSTGTQDGPLGSPLHIAAFRGHDAVIQLLLGGRRVAVDHRADPFGTALQAASAARKHTTVKLLLDNNADPNIIGGYLGTAVQAASTHLGRPGNDEILETLLSKGAEFLTEPDFWTTAYERAVSRDWVSGFRPRMSQESPSQAYPALLLQYRMPNLAGLDQLQHPQQLLAAVIRQWTLPGAERLTSDRFFKGLLCRIPFQDQLDAIKQAIPRMELTMQHLRLRDFLHKAMFWSGINAILARLPLLINQCLDQVRKHLRHDLEESMRVPASPSFPFRWAFKDFESGYKRYEEETSWSRRMAVKLNSVFAREFHMGRRRPSWDEQDNRDPIDSLARSDRMTIELTQRRQRYQQLEEISLAPTRDKDSADAAARKELRVASRPGVWVTSDILDLVKHLLQYGVRYVGYQDAAADMAEGAAPEHRKNVEDLTFELFSVVIRLTLALGARADNMESLADSVRLLTTVRLERIRQLDALCEQAFAPKGHGACACSHAPSKNDSGPKAGEIAAAVARQVEQTIEDKLGVSQADMVREIQGHVSSVVKEEVSRLVEQMQKDLEKKMYQEVQRQVAEAQTTQARRGLLWSPGNGGP